MLAILVAVKSFNCEEIKVLVAMVSYWWLR